MVCAVTVYYIVGFFFSFFLGNITCVRWRLERMEHSSLRISVVGYFLPVSEGVGSTVNYLDSINH